ncbi:Surfeit locus 6 [Kalmanozyma brasiliensis GHG001]|uniref:Establishment of cell polarity protein n=1 Tax=Kalmanozyma brasiliensis (strain GHG001) TaxID=1365824 RepID=V5GUN0_KALBG|nr:Surfeit locus 6 [Kalmanozyma brasiliensis GHG001]EST09597.1 Surfeit locus 6 [Kalmanozyma brasiliensis GHG001]
MAALKVASAKASTSALPNGTSPKKTPTKLSKSPKTTKVNGTDTNAEASASTSASVSSTVLTGKYIDSLTKHNSAFTSLLHLIPPQFYLTRDDADDLAEDGASSKYMKNKRKKAKSEIEAKERKDKLREAKKQRLDPDNFATVTDIQAERAAAKAAREAAEADSDLDMDIEGMVSADDDDEDDEIRGGPNGAAGDTDDDMQDSDEEDLPPKPSTQATDAAKSPAIKNVQTEGERKASIDALRAKLHAKIAGLQRKRGLPTDATDDASEDGSSVISSKDELLEERRRQRFDARERKKQEKKDARAAAKANIKAKRAGIDNAPNGQKSSNTFNVATKAPALLVAEPGYGDQRNGAAGAGASSIDVNGSSLNFSSLDFKPVGASGANIPDSSASGKKNRLALPSDPKAALQVLESRKRQEEARRAKLTAKMGDAPDALSAKVSELDEQKQWDKVLASATGVKIRDDEKLLKKAVKRKDKQKEKSSKAWNERQQQETQKQADRQKKRQDNIAARKAAKGGKNGNKKGSSSTLSKSKTPVGKKPSFGKARPGFEGKKIGRSKK